MAVLNVRTKFQKTNAFCLGTRKRRRCGQSFCSIWADLQSETGGYYRMEYEICTSEAATLPAGELTIHCWRLLFIYSVLKLFTGFAIAAFID